MSINGLVNDSAGYVKNFKSLQTVCFWVGGFGLVQSIIWIILTISGILSYNCVLSVEGTFNYGSLFQVVFLQLYFMGTCDNSIPAYDSSMLRQVKTVLNPEYIVIWDSVYLAFAVCWLLTSVGIMTYLKQDQPRTVSGVLWTWITVTFCVCLMDLALGIIFGIDYSRFSRKAYNYNLSSIYAGAINADAAQLLAGMVISMSMLILSLKGFVLWIINVGFLIYLAKRAIDIGNDNNGTDNLFMPCKNYDDILAIRPPINAYQDEGQKSSVMSTVFSNGGFEPDNQILENKAVINHEIIARAARISRDISLQGRRFHNLDNFKQYPPCSRPESIISEQSPQRQPTSPIIVAAFPAPDYTTQDEGQKSSVMSTVFSNGGFEPDNKIRENKAVINHEITARAARISRDISLQGRRFHNLDKFKKYPPSSRPESIISEQSPQRQQTSPIIVAAFPAPDYTPPMQRAAQNPIRNQRLK